MPPRGVCYGMFQCMMILGVVSDGLISGFQIEFSVGF